MNVLFCVEKERSLHFASAIHDLTDSQLRQATENYASLAGDHRSNYSTYTMLEAINSCQTEMDTEEMRLAQYFSIQIDETIDITAKNCFSICKYFRQSL